MRFLATKAQRKKLFYEIGNYNLVFKKEGYLPRNDLISISASQITNSSVTLNKASGKSGGDSQTGSSFFSKKNLIIAGGSTAVIGGVLFFLSQSDDNKEETGSVSISIEIP